MSVLPAGSLELLTSNNDNIVRCFSAETFQEKRCGTCPDATKYLTCSAPPLCCFLLDGSWVRF